MTIRILFVDDEPNILAGLRRQLHSRRGSWEMRFADSGEHAIETLGEWPADVVVTDMRMPCMDGAELLRRVRERWPSVIRFVLSGQAHHGELLRSIHQAHQYLAKPCDLDVLRVAVDRAVRARDGLERPEWIVAVTRLDHLPSLPALHEEITSGLRSDHLTMPEIAMLIEQDVALAAKVMQLVNSAFFGAPRHVASPAHAAVTLGMETLHALVLGSPLFESATVDGAGNVVLETIWMRSQQVAQLARGFATDFGLDTIASDQAFLAGLMHEIGRLVTLAGGETLHAPPPPVACPAMGAFLLATWGFAEDVVGAVARQARLECGMGHAPGVLAALQLAIGITNGEPADPAVLRALHATEAYARRRDIVRFPGDP